MSGLAGFLDAARLSLGAEQVLDAPALLDALSLPQARPAALLRPGSVEEIVLAVKLANEHRVPLLPCGGWTAMHYGDPAPSGAVALSLQRLDRLVEHSPADMVATAQAGLAFGAFQDRLHEHGQWLPFEAPAAATLGGLLATDRSGPRRLGYGTLRDQVLGLTVVNGDGVVRKCGGKVVKNVTGYDLAKLYIGSLGTLGVIVEATFKLRPRPETSSVQELEHDDFAAGFKLVRELVQRLPFVAAVAGFPGKPFVAQLGIDASPPDHARLLRELEAACSSGGARLRETGATHLDAEEFPPRPRRLRAVTLTDGRTVEPTLAARLTWPAFAGDFPEQIAALDQLAASHGFGLMMGFFEFPSRVSAELFGTLEGSEGAPAPDLDGMVKALRKAGLPVTVAWTGAEQTLSARAFGPPQRAWELMRGIKRALDPGAVLNPGRFVEGI
ncbi:MAG: hypothetical protein AMXMBFR7_34580 [Planctomycetota bacterium]